MSRSIDRLTLKARPDVAPSFSFTLPNRQPASSSLRDTIGHCRIREGFCFTLSASEVRSTHRFVPGKLSYWLATHRRRSMHGNQRANSKRCVTTQPRNEFVNMSQIGSIPRAPISSISQLYGVLISLESCSGTYSVR